jgi:hypothetical protein
VNLKLGASSCGPSAQKQVDCTDPVSTNTHLDGNLSLFLRIVFVLQAIISSLKNNGYTAFGCEKGRLSKICLIPIDLYRLHCHDLNLSNREVIRFSEAAHQFLLLQARHSFACNIHLLVEMTPCALI